MDLEAAEAWIRQHVDPVAPVVTAHERPWATVLRVPIADGVVWFKACSVVQAFEPRLTAELFARWPDRVPEVVAHDEGRAWLLLADAGDPVGESGAPETWLAALPPYAELQRGESAHARDHIAHGVPDLRVATLPRRLDELLGRDLPLQDDEVDRLRSFLPRFEVSCLELAAGPVSETIQHDDLHPWNLFRGDDRPRILDWGDASISNPFASLVETFRFLEEFNGLEPGDPWFARLRDAYLEPWGSGLDDLFALGCRVGTFTHAIAHLRQRDFLPEHARPEFDVAFAARLRRAVARTYE